ncbi:hypothetical protein Pmar_PMAR024968 [Perkinsus marinus ATCC 50983]|uniref:Uncharacterized protein n=1 Tax=Perkinsus marinus (strain ATCC 50983 / TXsc) TaxID=423536 RepID=C5LX65_PERM5|nr:hypothetical protein Pmar_PMAR024968 [Perkinsus marinus ATCC 50983]EEQ98674.1 hypothetical protein Pmar_PMAR024968 [Perkinsus marinus ATCC 50983]|eukprot:XP_002765957.1 hypothetical protein Pmar_PMAR024968 [Perkinsus marinus ATCC 50983]
MLGHTSVLSNPQLQQLYGAPPRKVFLTGRGSAVARPAQSPPVPSGPPSGARGTCKMMLAKLEMGEIVEIAKSRGIRVTSVVMNGREVKPTTAQLLRAMYRLETVYIEENFTAPDWGKNDEQNQAVDLRECKVVDVPRNPDEEEDAGNPSSPGPLAASKCLTILGPVNRAGYPYSGVFLHTIRQHTGVKPRRVEYRCRIGGRMHQGQGCLALLSALPLSQQTSPYQNQSAQATAVSQLIPRGGSLCPVASAFVIGFMENGISATGCPAWAYEPRKWYHIAVDFKWPSLEKCSCRNKLDRIHDADVPCELTKSDLHVTFWVNGKLVRKDARVTCDSRLLHNGFVACCIYNNSGHKADVSAAAGTSNAVVVPRAWWSDVRKGEYLKSSERQLLSETMMQHLLSLFREYIVKH